MEASVEKLTATRDPSDRRKVKLTWSPAKGATSYLLRYGITKDKPYQHDLIPGGKTSELTLYCLNNEPTYFFRIDALNAGGRTTGEVVVEAR